MLVPVVIVGVALVVTGILIARNNPILVEKVVSFVKGLKKK